MAVLNYAENYERALQQVYKEQLKFGQLYMAPDTSRYRWVNANTVQIPNIVVSGFVDVNRDTVGTYARAVDNNWVTYTLTHDREFKTLVDPMDIDETNLAITIANITNVFNREEKIPEMDKYMSSKLAADFVTHGGVLDTTALSVSNILTQFDSYMEDMDDAEVPQEGRILYVTPQVNTLLKTADDLSRYIRVDDNGGAIRRNVRSLDEVNIIVVPSARMNTSYDFTTGAVADGEQINMILIHPSCLLAPQKYEFVSLEQPSAHSSGKWLYYERKYWDVFVIEQKYEAIAINADAEV